MQSLAPRRLAKGDEAEGFEPRTHFLGRADHAVEGNVGRRVEIEYQSARNTRMTGFVVPWVIFYASDLRGSDQPFDTVDLDIGLAVTCHPYSRYMVRHALHLMSLEETLRFDSVRGADDRTWASLEVLDHPWPHRLQVAGEIAFGIALWRRPKRLVGF